MTIINDMPSIEGVSPESSDLSSSWNGDHGLGHRLAVRIDSAVADNIVRVDVLDRLSGTIQNGGEEILSASPDRSLRDGQDGTRLTPS